MARSDHEVIEELYLTKSEEKVIIDDDVDTLEMSTFDIIHHLLMRISGRFTQEEIDYLEEVTNTPVTLFNKDGKNNNYLTVTKIMQLLKLWRKHRKKDNDIPVNDNELDKLEVLTNNILDNKDIPQSDHKSILYLDKDYNSLPYLFGCIKQDQKVFKGVEIVPDTGASFSVISLKMFNEVKNTDTKIERNVNIAVNTATSSKLKAEGLWTTTIYIKATDNNYYKIPIKLLVINGPLDKILLGIPDLRKSEFNWQFAEGEENLELNCRDKENQSCRKSFATISYGEKGKFTNADNVFIDNKESKNVWFCSQVKPNMKKYKVKPRNTILQCSEHSTEEKYVINSIDTTNGSWPVMSTYWCQFQISCNKPYMFQQNQIFLTYEISPEDPVKMQTEEDLQILEEYYSSAETEQEKRYDLQEVPDIEGITLDKISIPNPMEKEEGKYWLPEMSHLPTEWQQKFSDLFFQYKDVFSNGPFDISTANVSPVTVEIKPGEIACEPIRRHNEQEKVIIDQYLENMLEKGWIREMEDNEYSDFNHCLLLTYRQDGKKQFVSSQADKLTGQERLDMLKKSSRLCSDLTKLNKISVSNGKMYLPKISEILPMFSRRCLSCTDIKHGFPNIKISPDSQKYFAFVHRNKRYVYQTLPQGWINSPVVFSAKMELVLNKESFIKYLKKLDKKDLMDMEFDEVIIKYVDDLSLLGKSIYCHYHVWEYLLQQFRKYKFKISAKKTQLLKDRIEFLGYSVCPRRGTYHLTPERRQTFLSWKLSKSRNHLLSRLATCNYFDSTLLGFKVITQCLNQAVKQKTFHLKRVHAIEWKLLQFVIELNVEFNIVDLNKNIYIQSDSSFSALSGGIFQYRINEDTKKSEMIICNFITRQFRKEDIHKSILYKEVISFMTMIYQYSQYIRSCNGKCIAFSDASSIQFLTRLKNINSRLYTFSLALSSYPNLYIYFSKGGFLNQLADNLSRQLAGQKIMAQGAIPRKYLEKLPVNNLGSIIITPKLLHQLCLDPLPSRFSDISERRKQKFQPVEEETMLLRKIIQEPYEKQILDSIWYGYQNINQDSVVFQHPEKKRILTKTEYEDMSKQLKFEEIKAHLMYIKNHSYHVQTTEDLNGEIIQFVMNLKSFMNQNKMNHTEPTLYGIISRFLLHSRVSLTNFKKLLECFMKSSIYNHGSKFENVERRLFLISYIHVESNVCLTVTENTNVNIHLTRDYELLPEKTTKINVKIHFKTKHVVTWRSLLEENIVDHIVMDYEFCRINFYSVLLYNSSKKSLYLKRNQVIGNFILHFDTNEKCSCEQKLNLSVLITTYYQSEEEEKLETKLLFHEVIKQQDTEEDLSLSPVYQLQQDIDDKDQSDRLVNRMVILAQLCTNQNIFNQNIIKESQKASQFVQSVKRKIMQETSDEFVIEQDILYHKEGTKKQLCLGDELTLLLLDSLHQRNQHFSQSVMSIIFSSYFYNVNLKKLIVKAEKRCSTCFFNHPCHRRNYVQNRNETSPSPIWSRVHSDLIENIPRSADNYNYICLFICSSTGYCQAYPMRSTKASELCKVFLQLLQACGIMEELVTDFAPMYRSLEFRELLKKYRIRSEKKCPRRSAENGMCESVCKLYRQSLTNTILTAGIEKRRFWPKYIAENTLMFNSSPLHSKINNVSRMNLFFNPGKYQSPNLYNINENENILQSLKQQKALVKIHEFRNKFRSYYKGFKNPFIIGQIVKVPLSKEEFKIIDNAGGLQQTVQNLYEVLETGKNNCRLKSVVDRSEITVDIGKIVPCNIEELQTCFNANLLEEKNTLDSFTRNIFKQGNGIPYLKEINDLPEVKEVHEDIKNNDEQEKEGETSTGTNEQKENNQENVTSSFANSDQEETKHNYNLRSRTQKINYVEQKKISFNPIVKKYTFMRKWSLDESGVIFAGVCNLEEETKTIYFSSLIPLDRTLSYQEIRLLKPHKNLD